MDSIETSREKIVHVCRRIYARGMVASNDGNVTVRVGERIVATPSGSSMGFLTEADLVVTDLEGNPVGGGERRVTSEIRLYVRIYEKRPDVRAAVHAHPVHATAFAAAGRTLDTTILTESVFTLGAVPLVPYGTPGTEELADRVEAYLEDYEVFLLANHGALALGSDVIEACHRMECLEHTARITYLAESLGGANRLSPEQIGGIFRAHGSKASPRIQKTGLRLSRKADTEPA